MLTNIKFKNFMRFSDECELSFIKQNKRKNKNNNIKDEQINVINGIIGPNSSGKTTVLRVLSFYVKVTNNELPGIAKFIFQRNHNKEMDVSELDQFFAHKDILKNKIDSFKSDEFSNINIALTFKDVEKEIKHSLEIGGEKIKESIYVNGRKEFENKSEIMSFESKIFDFYKELNFRTSQFKMINLNGMQRTNLKQPLKQEDREAFEKIIKIFDPSIEEVFYSDSKIGEPTSFLNDKGKKLDFSALSYGTRYWSNIIQVLMEMRTRKILLAIDEIGNGINHHIINLIFELFNTDFNKTNSQILFTTHNPFILKDMRKDAIFNVEHNGEIRRRDDLREDYVFHKNYFDGKESEFKLAREEIKKITSFLENIK